MRSLPLRPLLLPLFLIFFGASHCRADECDQLPKPSVTLKRLDAHPILNNTYSYKELTHLGAAGVRKGTQVLGLTRGTAIAQFETSIPLYIDRTGRWECASPQIIVSYGFNPMTISIAREFPEGSCAYKEIHQHELRHVSTYLTHLASIEKDLAETLAQRFNTEKPWRGPAGQTQTQLQRELKERWLPYIQREINRGDEAQERIDTAEEYARVANACNGEIRKRIQ
ncbi:MAG: hypothetical protein QG572_893 [Pseudomonadota bacterium]|nr:hypothetical protein [Pseudomonadota bacterium]MDQ5946658.1 hypothetical protein [Pseudomonadota bacterium]